MIQYVHKFRYVDSRFLCSRAHRQFVAKIAHCGQTHAGDAQVFANCRHIFHVEFIQRDDSVDFSRARCVAHRVQKFWERQIFGHEKHFIDRFARPVRISQFFYGKQINAAADGLACTQELLPFFIGADTKDCDWSPIRHARTPATP